MKYPFLIIVLIAATTAPAMAQQPVLPDLAPREVETRGNLEISFPSLRRQPLVGFNPPPRIPDIPADRRPFTLEYKQRRVDLPPSPLNPPAAPRGTSYADGPQYRGRIEAGAGVFGSRYAELEVALSQSESSNLLLSGGYTGLSSYQPGTIDAASDRGALAVSLLRPVGSATFRASLGGHFGSWADYAGIAPNDEWTLAGGHLDLGLSNARIAPVHYRLSTQVSGSQLDAGGSTVDDPGAAVSGAVTFGPSSAQFSVEGGAGRRSLSDTGEVLDYEAGLSGRFALGARTRVSVGARVLGTESGASATAEDQRWAYLAPVLRAEIALGRSLRFTASNTPRNESVSLAEIYAANPYASPALTPTTGTNRPALETQVIPADARVALTGETTVLRWSAFAGYLWSPNRRYTQSTTVGLLTAYDEASEMEAGVRLQALVAPGVTLHAQGAVREGTLERLDRDLPHFAPWTAEGGFSLSFAGQRGLFQATGSLLGERPSGAGTDVPLSADVDLMLGFHIVPPIGVHLRLLNLAGSHEVWDGYPQPGTVFQMGLSGRW